MSGLVRDHCLAPERVDAPIYGGRYRSLFEDLPPLRVDEGALHALGRPGGPCDLGADAEEDTDAEAAGWPFFGQLIAHDITADRSPIARRRRPRGADSNARAPKLNLEMLYSGRPDRLAVPVRPRGTRPRSCSALGRPRRAPQPAGRSADRRCPQRRAPVRAHPSARRPTARATTASSTCCARTACPSPTLRRPAARTTLTWHYQWVVVHDFLPRLVGTDLVDDVLAEGGRWFPRAAAAAGVHPARVRRRGLPLRPRPDPTHLPARRERCRSVPAVPRPGRVRPAGRRSTAGSRFAGLRPARPPAGPARQAPRRPARRQPHRAARARSPARSTPLPPTGPSPYATCCAARPPGCPAARRSPDSSGWRAADHRRAGPRLAGRHPAVVLHPQGGRAPRRRRPARPGRRSDRGGGPDGAPAPPTRRAYPSAWSRAGHRHCPSAGPESTAWRTSSRRRTSVAESATSRAAAVTSRRAWRPPVVPRVHRGMRRVAGRALSHGRSEARYLRGQPPRSRRH